MVKLNEAIELAVVRKVGINQITKSYRQENSETNRDVAKLCLVREGRQNETKKSLKNSKMIHSVNSLSLSNRMFSV